MPPWILIVQPDRAALAVFSTIFPFSGTWRSQFSHSFFFFLRPVLRLDCFVALSFALFPFNVIFTTRAVVLLPHYFWLHRKKTKTNKKKGTNLLVSFSRQTGFHFGSSYRLVQKTAPKCRRRTPLFPASSWIFPSVEPLVRLISKQHVPSPLPLAVPFLFFPCLQI